MSGSPLLAAQQVVASRPDDSGKMKTVLKETTIAVDAGELLSVVGPSGSGKSTLLRLFNRLLEPEQGRVMLAGKDLRSFDPPDLRVRVPVVSQKPYLYAGTVRDNLTTPAKLRRMALPDLNSDEIRNVLEVCQVDPAWLDRDARKLSVGQQQRVCLARAMMGPNQALLLDEPTSALDRPVADKFAKAFRRLAVEKKLAIILVTHDLRLAEMCADRIALMHDGTIVEVGPTDQILNQPQTPAARKFLATVTDTEPEA